VQGVELGVVNWIHQMVQRIS